MWTVTQDYFGFLYFALQLVQSTRATFLTNQPTQLSHPDFPALRSSAFSCALDGFHVLTMTSDWLLVVASFVLIGCCDHFGVCFTTLN